MTPKLLAALLLAGCAETALEPAAVPYEALLGDASAPLPLEPEPVPITSALVAPRFEAADTPAELGAAWRSFRAGDSMGARAGLAAFLEAHPGHPLSPEAGLLLGVILERAGSPGQASPVFAAASEGLDALADFARFRGARTAEMAGRRAEALALADAVAPHGRFGPRAGRMLGRLLLRLGRPADAAPILSRELARARGRTERLLHYDLAQAVEAAGDLPRAAALYREIRIRWEGTLTAKGALKRYRPLRWKIPRETWRRISGPSPEVAVAEARARHGSHRSDAVVAAMDALLEGEGAPQEGSGAWCDAVWLAARARTKLRDHPAAAEVYRRFVGGCGGDHRVVDAMLAAGKGLFTADDGEGALGWLGMLRQAFPDHPYADDALYVAARIHRQAGRVDEARAALEVLLREHPKGDMAAPAHWMLLAEKLDRGDYQGAARYPPHADASEQDRYSRGRLAYFRAFALDRGGEREAAAEAYQAVVASQAMSYYALLAANRLGELEPATYVSRLDAAVRARLGEAPTLPPPLLEDDDFAGGLALLRLGLPTAAWRAFRAAEDRWVGDAEDYRFRIERLFRLAGWGSVADNVLRREMTHLDGVWPDGAFREAFDMVYPSAFEAHIERWSTERAVPEALVYAIIREESRFDPRVESWANACGLMQLMVPTARELARADGIRGASRISCRRLFSPRLAIRLGTRFLSDLQSDYGEHPGVVVAAYHAGYGNLGRWRERWPEIDHRFDRWVEAIPFRQTRHYVKRVLPALFAYQWLHAEPGTPMSARVPRVPITLPGGGG